MSCSMRTGGVFGQDQLLLIEVVFDNLAHLSGRDDAQVDADAQEDQIKNQD